MEPRPPKPPRSAPRQPQQQPQQPAWDQTGQPIAPNQPPAGNRRDGGYPGSNRYPEYPSYDQQPPVYPPQPGQGYPAPQQPGYGQQPPADPYSGYQRPVYPPAAPQGGYPAGYPGNAPDPYAGYGGQQVYPPQPGAFPPANQTGQIPAQTPTGRAGSGGWIAPLPDEDLSSIQPSTYGGGYGGGGFSGDPRSGRPAPGPNRQTQIIAALAIGGLALMILAIVIGFIVFGGDDNKDNATPTVAAGLTTGLTPTTSDAAQAQTTPTVATGETAVTPTVVVTETATVAAENTEPTAAPTEAPADTTDGGASAGLINGDDGESLLPAVDELPAPNFVDTTVDADRRYNRADVAQSLGDQDGSINDELRTNGFDSNWRREFTLDDANATGEETSVFFVSATVFRTEQGAADSYHLYLDAAAEGGYTEVDGESLGERSTTLELSGSGTTSVIYVQQGNVIFRIYGYSVDGNPGADVLALTQTVLGKM
ncbi:MAG: hypothetical protein ACRDHN_18580 [Thermomicrobiales bacterium]